MSCENCKRMEEALVDVVKRHNEIMRKAKTIKKQRGRQGLTRSEIRSILILSKFRDMSIREIAEKTGFSKSVVGKYVKLMHENVYTWRGAKFTKNDGSKSEKNERRKT